MNEFIFRKYDIRGVVKTDFTDDVVQILDVHLVRTCYVVVVRRLR